MPLARGGTDKDWSRAPSEVRVAVGYEGKRAFGASTPDGTAQQLIDVTQLAKLWWTVTTPLDDGIRRAVASFLADRAKRD